MGGHEPEHGRNGSKPVPPSNVLLGMSRVQCLRGRHRYRGRVFRRCRRRRLCHCHYCPLSSLPTLQHAVAVAAVAATVGGCVLHRLLAVSVNVSVLLHSLPYLLMCQSSQSVPPSTRTPVLGPVDVFRSTNNSRPIKATSPQIQERLQMSNHPRPPPQ